MVVIARKFAAKIGLEIKHSCSQYTGSYRRVRSPPGHLKAFSKWPVSLTLPLGQTACFEISISCRTGNWLPPLILKAEKDWREHVEFCRQWSEDKKGKFILRMVRSGLYPTTSQPTTCVNSSAYMCPPNAFTRVEWIQPTTYLNAFDQYYIDLHMGLSFLWESTSLPK